MVNVTDDPFASVDDTSGEPPKRFGNVYRGRYHMPRLPGDVAAKGRVPHEPGGLMRTTNLVGAFVDTKALNDWEMQQAFIGLAEQPSLHEELSLRWAKARRDGVHPQRLKEYPEFRDWLTGSPGRDSETSLAGRAKQAAGANEARQAGTNRHDAWEHRALTGDLIGTPAIQAQILAVEMLLQEAFLERVPGLSERVVRNVELNCAGRFDDIVRDTRTRTLYVADLKTKRTAFFSWTEVDAQLAIYARAELMLQGDEYVPGPVTAVDQERAVVLHMPSDGAPPALRTADLVTGWRVAKLARQVVDERAYGKSAARQAFSPWRTEIGS